MRKLLAWNSFAAVLLAALVADGRGPDLLRPDRAVHEAIDHYVNARLAAEKITAAQTASDANLIRRLTLDLAGRIPTRLEARAYIDSKAGDKRAQLVDRLMAAPSYNRYLATALDAELMHNSGGSMRDYFLLALDENRPWDRIYREIVTARQTKVEEPKKPDDKQRAEIARRKAENQAAEYLRRRVRDLDKVTADVSADFFGVNVSCARCHDHPLVDDWKQDHYFGMKSFFSRTFDNGDFLGERDYGIVNFKTTSGESKDARLMFLTGAALEEPESKEPDKDQQKAEKKRLDELKKNKEPPPAPKFSRRAKLIEVSLNDGQRDFFTRAVVNRLFYRYFGQGLVMPIDQMHSGNDPSHPDLLAWLARDLESHAFDLRRLVRGIVMSEAYARSSRSPSGDPPDAEYFAVAQVRPLAPQQLGASLRLAATDPDSFPADMKPEDFQSRIESIDNSGRGLAGQFEQPSENFQISVTEALWFSNNDCPAKELLSDSGGQLVGRLKAIENLRTRIELAVWAVLSRPPTEEEAKLLEDYFVQREDRVVDACRQVVWALMTSSEFRFNY